MPVTITIRVHRDGDTLVVDVTDDGVGGATLDELVKFSV
jgi:signal transduction histidine kinase